MDPFDVDFFDAAGDYVKLMKSIFDFQSLQKLIASPKFSFCYDALHGVAGAYASRIFVEELGAKESSLLNCVPKVISAKLVQIGSLILAIRGSHQMGLTSQTGGLFLRF